MLMKTIEFAKYEGTGNDFIVIDNLDGRYDYLSANDVKKLCNLFYA